MTQNRCMSKIICQPAEYRIKGFEQSAVLGEAIGFEALTNYAREQIKAAEAQ